MVALSALLKRARQATPAGAEKEAVWGVEQRGAARPNGPVTPNSLFIGMRNRSTGG